MLFLAMFIRKRINKSSSVSIQIISKSNGKYVPGAFMSLLSIGFLSEAINEKHIEKPN
jgi:hypothetical protein